MKTCNLRTAFGGASATETALMDCAPASHTKLWLQLRLGNLAVPKSAGTMFIPQGWHIESPLNFKVLSQKTLLVARVLYGVAAALGLDAMFYM